MTKQLKTILKKDAEIGINEIDDLMDKIKTKYYYVEYLLKILQEHNIQVKKFKNFKPLDYIAIVFPEILEKEKEKN